MPPEAVSVTVIILNYNGEGILDRCIASLRAQRIPPARVLLIDNGSTDFDEEKARKQFGQEYSERLEIVKLPENLGYVKGMNFGIKCVLSSSFRTEWIMTLNNDTELEPDFFENFAKIECDVFIGMAAPKVKSMKDHSLLDAAGIVVALDGMSTARGQREKDVGQFDADTHVLIPNGVAAIYRAAMLDDVGLLDEHFEVYCEDSDLGLRAWLAGWDCLFLPDCIVYHARSSSYGEFSLSKLYHVERNHYWVAFKNLPLPIVALSPAFTAYRYAVQAFALVTRKGQGFGYGRNFQKSELIKTTFKACFDAWLGIPIMLKQRRMVGKSRRRGFFEVYATLLKNRLRFSDLILK